jgi:AbrB family looped-hinge helix DNA binding protein
MMTKPTIVGPEGEIVIPSELRVALDIRPGTRIAVSREGNRLILEPVNKEYVRSLRGSLAGGPSMTDDLLKERREEEARSKW